jgi:hypothetical protein
MSIEDSQFCFPPNPDIAGVGVRIATYAQAFHTLIPLAVVLSFGSSTHPDRQALHLIFTGLIVTALALIISAFIQAGIGQLSFYHAVIVLQLSWANNLSLIAYGRSLIFDKNSGVSQLPGFTFSNYSTSDWIGITLASIQICLTSAFGLWVWGTLNSFGSYPQCTPLLHFSLFGHDLSNTNYLSFYRVLTIIVHMITAIPVLNVEIVSSLLYFLSMVSTALAYLLYLTTKSILHKIYSRLVNASYETNSEVPAAFNQPSGVWHSAPVTGVFIVQVAFVLDTELIIYRNQSLVGGGENEWSFGQTLSLFLVVPAMFTTAKRLMNWYKRHVACRSASGTDHTGSEIPDLDKELITSQAPTLIEGDRPRRRYSV